jgi:hypothetical protein
MRDQVPEDAVDLSAIKFDAIMLDDIKHDGTQICCIL